MQRVTTGNSRVLNTLRSKSQIAPLQENKNSMLGNLRYYNLGYNLQMEDVVMGTFILGYLVIGGLCWLFGTWFGGNLSGG